MNEYLLLKLAHLLLLVYWLGADIGVFYAARFVRDRSLSIEARKMAVKIMGWIDQIPRYCLVLSLPVGYSLAREIGVVRMSAGNMIVLWLVGLAWLWMVWTIHHRQGTQLAERLRKVDLTWRVVLTLGLIWDALQGLRGAGHLLADWIAVKFLLFAALVFCGIMIRILGRPIGPALRQVLSTGSTPDLEADIARGFDRTRPFVLGIWLLLLVTAWVGLSKPTWG